MNYETIGKIAREYSSPMYVFSKDDFRRNFYELNSAYKKYYNNFKIAYSFKTNYMPQVCYQVLDYCGYAEVVSDMEYKLAKRYGFSPDNIIVNGPGKWNGMEDMLVDGATVMFDNEFEVEKMIKIAANSNKVFHVGFRLNFDIGTSKKSRFGFEADGEFLRYVIRRVRNVKNVKICGLHFHLGGSRSLEAWKNRAQKMIRYADELLEESEKKIIDLGSGMFGHLDPLLATQFNQSIPSFDDYAQVVASEFSSRYREQKNKPVLVVEPGTTLIANTMSYVTRVLAIKKICDRNIAIVDGSVQQLGELGRKKRLPIHVFGGKYNEVENVDITGYTCLEDDVLYRGYSGGMEVGDFVCLDNCGAYTNVLKPPFIQVGCKIVEYSDNGEFRIIKHQETVDDILSTYVEN